VEGFSFSIAHSLAAHRPLGSIRRAQLHAYPTLARLMAPTSLDQVPA